jgi:hypothetical protein
MIEDEIAYLFCTLSVLQVFEYIIFFLVEVTPSFARWLALQGLIPRSSSEAVQGR